MDGNLSLPPPPRVQKSEGRTPAFLPTPTTSTMKITTPQITWHGGEAGKNDPVLSADVHPCGVLATGGADAEVRVSRFGRSIGEADKEREDGKYVECKCICHTFVGRKCSVSCFTSLRGRGRLHFLPSLVAMRG